MTVIYMEVCAICGKELTNPRSIERGIGPDCLSKVGTPNIELKKRMRDMFQGNEPRFTYSAMNGVIVITDLYDPAYPTMTVTTGIDGVISNIVKESFGKPEIIDKIPVIYRDTSGDYDMVMTVGGKFSQIVSLGGVTDLNKAIKLARERHGECQ